MHRDEVKSCAVFGCDLLQVRYSHVLMPDMFQALILCSHALIIERQFEIMRSSCLSFASDEKTRPDLA